jgi:hypothetical protein
MLLEAGRRARVQIAAEHLLPAARATLAAALLPLLDGHP